MAIENQQDVSYEQQMLRHAERQSDALEALRNFALIVLVLAGLGLLIGLIATFSG